MRDKDNIQETQDDAYAARRAALEQQFRALPPGGSTEYWRVIEDTSSQQPMPLETLARCLRERHAAGANEDAQRIFNIIVLRVQTTTRRWAWVIAKQAHSGMKPQLQEDLEQEAYMKLWEEVEDDGPTFLLENFSHAFNRLRQHVAQDMLIKAGERQRPGVEQSERVPRAQIDSLQAEAAGADDLTLADRLGDPSAQNAFEQAELSDVFALVMSLPDDQRTLILGRYWLDQSQEKTAATLGISDRMVRYRLKAILRELGVRYHGDEEEGNRG